MNERRLYLLRHAKSRPAEPAQADFARPLGRRGRDDALRLAQHIAQSAIAPDCILCSPARRTRETLAPILAAAGWQMPVHHEDGLYLAETEPLLGRLAALPDACRTVLLVGHNPGLHALALHLAITGPSALRARMAAKFPTGALAEILFDPEPWPAVLAAGGRLVRFIVPRDLPSA
ncbi:MAG: histidine phosphatase family protein [Rhodothalassiaceae bacterium]